MSYVKSELNMNWNFFVNDDWTYFNTYTFANRIHNVTKERIIEPSETLVTEAYQRLELKFHELSNWYGDIKSRMITVLEAGSLNNRLHLHSLIKHDKQKEDWTWRLNNWWYNGDYNGTPINNPNGYGAYNISKITDSTRGALVSAYVTKVQSYINKDNNKQNYKFFPHFWDTNSTN